MNEKHITGFRLKRSDQANIWEVWPDLDKFQVSRPDNSLDSGYPSYKIWFWRNNSCDSWWIGGEYTLIFFDDGSTQEFSPEKGTIDQLGDFLETYSKNLCYREDDLETFDDDDILDI
jgi:hypothetical protein